MPGPLQSARFLERPNRFIVHCELEDGTPARAHLADPGRLVELLVPGCRVWLRPADDERRATSWSAVLVEAQPAGTLVSLVTTLPNRLVAECLRLGALPELAGWSVVRAEARLGRSRLDFLLRREDGHMALEIKSVTLVNDDVAMFPDCVTARGVRHLEELMTIRHNRGWEAAIVLVAQRGDCSRFRPARHIDPAFADALGRAHQAGVTILCRRCVVTRQALRLDAALPVEL